MVTKQEHEAALRLAIKALRAQAHDIQGHLMTPHLMRKEDTAEWRAAILLAKIFSTEMPARDGFEDVEAAYAKFQIPLAPGPMFLDAAAESFRVKFIQEEFDELKEGLAEQDMLKTGDALVDLVYVCFGFALMMGLPWKKMWDEVQTKNMQKERATSEDQSKRGTKLDIIKPAGWTSPDHSQFIGKGPWRVFNTESLSVTALSEQDFAKLEERVVADLVLSKSEKEKLITVRDYDGLEVHRDDWRRWAKLISRELAQFSGARGPSGDFKRVTLTDKGITALCLTEQQ